MCLSQNEPNIKQTNKTNGTIAGELGGKTLKGPGGLHVPDFLL